MNEQEVTIAFGDVETRCILTLIVYVQLDVSTTEFDVVKSDRGDIQKYLAPKIRHELMNYIYTDKDTS